MYSYMPLLVVDMRKYGKTKQALPGILILLFYLKFYVTNKELHHKK
jgi:hypothetical protein